MCEILELINGMAKIFFYFKCIYFILNAFIYLYKINAVILNAFIYFERDRATGGGAERECQAGSMLWSMHRAQRGA